MIALRRQQNQHDLESNSDALKPVKQFPSTQTSKSLYFRILKKGQQNGPKYSKISNSIKDRH